MSNVVTVSAAAQARPADATLAAWTPRLVIAPSALASLVYVFGFTLWTLYISLSNSTMLPTYKFVGLKPYFDLWSNERWQIAYGNLFYFSAFYVVLALAVGLALAIAIDQRVQGRGRVADDLPLSAGGLVRGHRHGLELALQPRRRHRISRAQPGLARFHLPPDHEPRHRDLCDHRHGIWQSSGFAMALFLAGLRSVDPDLVKAAQIDGAGPARIYRKVILPSIAPIFVAVVVVLLQFAIKTFDLVVALTQGGPGISTTFPANYVYDLMFQRGEIAVGAAAAIMMLAALAVVLVPYALWTVWRSRRAAAHG